MANVRVQTSSAPAAIGPYSQAVIVGNLVFVSGQIPLLPGDDTIVASGIEEQTRQVLHNLAAVLEASGAGLEAVAKTTIYLTDLSNFAACNAVYAEFFKHNLPARATVEVSALPKGALVEIDAVAQLTQPTA